ncbi:hypothetical protein BpHYR1_026492 [Brachionus plicatilis]|uniref:Uncharacterized protein n=1 Tax=Brachionus plicatilis TaxID=10195 RepID=A0A3M7QI00_BRAPC|nr:hypothetical protein BpHYR1_026492 [Brachionus plicatilis]
MKLLVLTRYIGVGLIDRFGQTVFEPVSSQIGSIFQIEKLETIKILDESAQHNQTPNHLLDRLTLSVIEVELWIKLDA